MSENGCFPCEWGGSGIRHSVPGQRRGQVSLRAGDGVSQIVKYELTQRSVVGREKMGEGGQSELGLYRQNEQSYL